MKKLAAGIVVAATLGAGLAGCARASAQTSGCSATQPVYSVSYKLIGTWQVTLPVGQSVTLPDGDTATCATGNRLVVR